MLFNEAYGRARMHLENDGHRPFFAADCPELIHRHPKSVSLGDGDHFRGNDHSGWKLIHGTKRKENCWWSKSKQKQNTHPACKVVREIKSSLKKKIVPSFLERYVRGITAKRNIILQTPRTQVSKWYTFSLDAQAVPYRPLEVLFCFCIVVSPIPNRVTSGIGHWWVYIGCSNNNSNSSSNKHR